MVIIVQFAAGLLFGLGLLVSGMADPVKVQGFLDVTGKWDPSLALVMAGAIGVGYFAFRKACGRALSFLGEEMRLPGSNAVDRRLLLGALLFGIGWGLAGYCPGPALVAFAGGSAEASVFLVAMLCGMAAFEIMERMVLRKGALACN